MSYIIRSLHGEKSCIHSCERQQTQLYIPTSESYRAEEEQNLIIRLKAMDFDKPLCQSHRTREDSRPHAHAHMFCYNIVYICAYRSFSPFEKYV